jgi:hypothetical protein
VSEFVKLAAGALFGVFVGLLVGWWKSHRDELRGLCDECCRTILDAADVATSYWLSAGSDTNSAANEARIMGLQVRLDGYRVMVTEFLEPGQRKKLEVAFVAFYDTLTGGDFKSPKRSIDEVRAYAALTKASIVIIAVRQGFYKTVSFRRAFLKPLRWLFLIDRAEP